MKGKWCRPGCCVLGLTMGLSVLMVGCASRPSSKSPPPYCLSDLEGAWSWTQDPWYGEFVLKKDGDSCTGTLDDVYEQTFGDRIADVVVSDDRIQFTRYGQYGIQNWEGTLKAEDGILKIVDGQWTKRGGVSGEFTAEKKK